MAFARGFRTPDRRAASPLAAKLAIERLKAADIYLQTATDFVSLALDRPTLADGARPASCSCTRSISPPRARACTCRQCPGVHFPDGRHRVIGTLLRRNWLAHSRRQAAGWSSRSRLMSVRLPRGRIRMGLVQRDTG